MKKTLALLAVPAFMMAASTATAENQWGVTPYVGADAEWRHLNFQKGQGDNIFRHDFPQGNIYAGLKFNEYVAIEGGFESTGRKSRTAVVAAGETIASTSAGNLPLGVTTTSQLKGLHANLVGFLPIYDAYRLQLIGIVGFARLQESNVLTVQTRNGIVTTGLAAAPIVYKQRRTVPRFGVGVQHKINESWGVRAMLKWENTNKLRIGATDGPSKIRDRNSFIYSLGTFVTF